MPETCGSPAALGPGIGGPFPTAGVIDPHTVTRVALPLVLTEFDWVDAGATVADFLAARPAVDVVLLAVHRDGADGAPFTAWTRAVRSLVRAGYPVCLLTSERSPVMLHGCLTAGARAVAHSTDPLDDLRAAVRAAADGRLWVTDSLAPLANLSSSRPNLPSLTERQRVILSARARGEKFDSIARRLFISRKVAEEHWAAVARKYASFLRDHSPADLERLLGLEPVDLTDPPADLLAG